ncbi:excinuclease ABC subunit C [Candidatus Daviesbacteria bacterium RIFCSPLOWO2_02_FULL_36_8]|uniref:Excinuclease ABC subunit C n=1 Tax=Candidatus Daviesbacteria bacterium RIFCSPLOWO2_02_FULL_36_8 TaxID=1797793 RepID=A0A1F5MFM7_9BACT|nr:MAG: excinuclease ABC subunit C [Candidatus Daviesbacteria bacterium RIFCSPLOWO2_02_FULL_36_8]
MVSRYFYVYVLSNFRRTVLYTGITSNLVKRVYEHKNNLADGFSKKYGVHDLLYYEVFDNPNSAIEREKQIKGWSRKKKDQLIIQFNPKLKDLYGEIV